MKGARWFLWDIYMKIILASTGVMSALSLAVSQAVRIEYFAAYYYMLPMMVVMFMAIYSFNLTIAPRNMALSMNCRRADFFWTSQAAFVVTDVVCILIVWLAGNLPGLLGWGYAFSDSEKYTFINGAPLYAGPGMCLFLLAVCLFLQPIGAAAGCLYDKHKALATVFIIIVVFLGMVGTVILLLVGDGSIPKNIMRTIGGVTLAVLGVLCALCEVHYYRSNARAVVR